MLEPQAFQAQMQEGTVGMSQSLDGSFPPTPAEDRGSQRLSWSNLLQRLTELNGLSHRDAADHYCRSENGSVADLSRSDSESSFFCFPLEETLAAEVVTLITESLHNASSLLCCSKLILPENLLHTISEELLHLAVNEPCGLRGALIDLCVDRGDQGSPCEVDRIAVDPALVPTFHVTLVLRLESSGLWPKVQKLFRGGKPQGPPRQLSTLRLKPNFRAIRRKLYSSGELLVEECP